MPKTKRGVAKSLTKTARLPKELILSESEIIAGLKKRERDYRDLLREYDEFLSIANRIGDKRYSPEIAVDFGLAEIEYRHLRLTLDQMAEPSSYVRAALAVLRRDHPNIFAYINRSREK
jgi:hypothetical protein